MQTHEKIIEKLNLSKHPEGGYYRQTYKSGLIVLIYAILRYTHLLFFIKGHV
jgi:predicted cupin superfamily sugar epimerase